MVPKFDPEFEGIARVIPLPVNACSFDKEQVVGSEFPHKV